MPLFLLAAGASKGLVLALQPAFTARTGCALDAVFDAVGAIRELFIGAASCDVLISTAAQIADLTAQGLLAAGSAAALGAVGTGVAVPTGQTVPNISTQAGFAAALLAAEAVFVPDPYRSTAGIHFMSVISQLGIKAELEPRLRAFANGATAMRHLADGGAANTIGATQITEIRYTEGLTLVGPLPKAFALSTVYSAAVSTRAAHPEAARQLVEWLTGPLAQDLRRGGGFEPVPGG